ncbi:MAG TPA: hypothetical protein VIM98_02635 [Dyella sp.]|uniref:hypothetical protein n=1 Tax=Dyella sp. TaxID=1869338 RepID=UPI002F9385C1
MTITRPSFVAALGRHFLRLAIWAVLLAAGPVFAQAKPKPAAPPPAPHVYQPPASAYQYKQAQQQQQTTDQLQREQQRQQRQQAIQNTANLPNANNKALLNQTNAAQSANQDRSRAEQQDLIDRYRNAVSPPVSEPARASSR